jgi:hypothetical protein
VTAIATRQEKATREMRIEGRSKSSDSIGENAPLCARCRCRVAMGDEQIVRARIALFVERGAGNARRLGVGEGG